MPARKHFFAIRHIPSGGFLPQMTSYGFTRASPSLTDPPRLFTKSGAAKQALDRWLQGEWYEGKFDEDSGEQQITVRPIATRIRAHMEIVEIECVVRSLTEAELRRL